MTVSTRPVQWITPHVPEANLLAAIGAVVVRHVHLDHMLKMTIKSLLGISVDEALADLVRKPSYKLRKQIENEARRRLGKGPDFRRLMELLDRCRRASERRNFMVKSVYAMHLSEPHLGLQTVLHVDLKWYDVPLHDDVEKLAEDIGSLVDEITEARLHGWLEAAIEASGESVD